MALFALLFMHGFSVTLQRRVFGFAKARAGSGSEFERMAVDLTGLGLAGLVISFSFGLGLRGRLAAGLVCSTSCFWRLADEIVGA